MTILISGSAGTGKTYLVNKLKDEYPALCCSSTTWVSSLLVNSETYYRRLHLKAGFEKEAEQSAHKKTRKDILIDEASMLSREQLESLKKRFPYCNFILLGDFNQLKPVEGESINSGQIDYYVKLNVQHRSIDNRLNVFLDNILNNKLTPDDIDFIEKRTLSEQDDPFRLNCTGLYYVNSKRREHNSYWATYNDKEKSSLGSKLIARNYIYADTDDDNNIIYKPREAKWHNNEQFIVDSRGKGVLTLKNENRKITILAEWLKFFELAEAITIHKSQGTTITGNIVVDLDSIFESSVSLWEKAQLLYVACSRVKSMSQLYFKGKIGRFMTINPFGPRSPDFECDNDFLLSLLERPSQDIRTSGAKTELSQKIIEIVISKSSRTVNLLHTINSAQQVYTFGPRALSTRKLASLAGVSAMMVSKLRKKGLTDSQILQRYNAAVPEETEMKETGVESWSGVTQEALDEYWKQFGLVEPTRLTAEPPPPPPKQLPGLYLQVACADGSTEIGPVSFERAREILQRDFVGPIEYTQSPNIRIVVEEKAFDCFELNKGA